MGSLITLIILMIILMVALKLIFINIDGKGAKKQCNVRYFLQFTQNFAYGRTNYIFFMALIIFVLSNPISIFSLNGLLQFLLLLCVAVIIDIVSQYAYFMTGKRKFKKEIEDCVAFLNKLKSLKTCEDVDDDIIEPQYQFDFEEIVEEYLEQDQHIGIASMDGGKFVNSIKHLPPITYVIDVYEQRARELLSDKNIKVTTLTKDKGLPFKDGKIDTYICNYTNFNKLDVLRILKSNGLLIIKQRGSEHLKELNSMYFPMIKTTQWNRYICESILIQTGFNILQGNEQLGKVQFKSLEGLFTYLRRSMPNYVEQVHLHINQLAFISQCIEQRGYFELTFHEFYLVCQKK